MEYPAGHNEFAFALVVNRPWLFPCGVNPCLNHFQDEEIILGDELRIWLGNRNCPE